VGSKGTRIPAGTKNAVKPAERTARQERFSEQSARLRVAMALHVAKITVAAKVIGSASKFWQRGFHWRQLEGS
jgi:hypothetical protein